jgi:uncharacterized protein YndB with AHSA1/START domain
VTDPLRLSYPLSCSADHAFDVWTTRIATWWPNGHSTTGESGAVVVLERQTGGRIFERTANGTEVDWGVITEWSPPCRLAYTWHIGRPATQATDVSLTFVDLGDGRSRLDIVHTGWDRLGAEAQAWRDANTNGWAGLIPSFRNAAEAGPGSES